MRGPGWRRATVGPALLDPSNPHQGSAPVFPVSQGPESGVSSLPETFRASLVSVSLEMLPPPPRTAFLPPPPAGHPRPALRPATRSPRAGRSASRLSAHRPQSCVRLRAQSPASAPNRPPPTAGFPAPAAQTGDPGATKLSSPRPHPRTGQLVVRQLHPRSAPQPEVPRPPSSATGRMAEVPPRALCSCPPANAWPRSREPAQTRAGRRHPLRPPEAAAPPEPRRAPSGALRTPSEAPSAPSPVLCRGLAPPVPCRSPTAVRALPLGLPCPDPLPNAHSPPTQLTCPSHSGLPVPRPCGGPPGAHPPRRVFGWGVLFLSPVRSQHV